MASRARSEPTTTDDTAVSGSSAPTPGGKKSACRCMAGWSNVRFRPDTLGQNIARPEPLLQLRARTCAFSRTDTASSHQLNWDVKNQSLLAASDRQLLQCAVLRFLRRIPVHRSQPASAASPRPAGLAISFFGHARRHRQRLEHLRRARRHEPGNPRPPTSTRHGRNVLNSRADERNTPRRRGWNPPPSADAGRLQAAPPDLQQADGVLPAVDAHAGGHPGHPAHFDAVRHRRLQPAARRRQPPRAAASSTPCSRGPKGSRSRSSSAASSSATSPVALALGDNIFYGHGLSEVLRSAQRAHIGRDGVRLHRQGSRALRRRRVRPRRASHRHRREAQARRSRHGR